MRLPDDSNIVARAVHEMRAAGHDVVYLGERTADPGDQAPLAEAVADGRIILTKDHDTGVLVHRDRQPHCGVDDWVMLPPNPAWYLRHCRLIAIDWLRKPS